MEKVKAFLKRKNIVISAKRYGIDALGAMAQGLFCSLLIGTILNTIGTQFGISFLTEPILYLGKGDGLVGYTIGGVASLMVGPAMAVAIAVRKRQLHGQRIVFAVFHAERKNCAALLILVHECIRREARAVVFVMPRRQDV